MSNTPPPQGVTNIAAANSTGPTTNVAQLPIAPKSDPYAALVTDPNDLLAALAYVAHKHHEIEFTKAIEAKGDQVTPEKLEAFRIACCVDSQLEKYMARAEKLVQVFLTVSLDAKKAELEREFAATATGQQLGTIIQKFSEKRTWRGWLADCGNNLTVQFATIVLVAGLFFGFQALDSIAGAAGRYFKLLPNNESADQTAEKAAPAAAPAAERSAVAGSSRAAAKQNAPEPSAKNASSASTAAARAGS